MPARDSGGVVLLEPVAAAKWLLVVLVVIVLLAGVALALGVLGVPSVTGVDNEFAAVNESVTTVDSNVRVHNPNPVGVSVESVDVAHTVYGNGIELGRGEREAIPLPVGNSTIPVETSLRNDRIPEWWASHAERGERTNLTVRTALTAGLFDRSVSRTVAERTVTTGVIAAFVTNRTRPIDASSDIVSDPILYVNESAARWTNVTVNRTVATANLTVTNPKSIPIPLDDVTYNLSMNGAVVGNGSTRNLTAIPPDTTTNVTARLVLDNSELDEWWVSHVERNQTTTVRFDYTVQVDLSRYGMDTRTYSPPPIERSFRTDIFGDDSGGGTISVS